MEALVRKRATIKANMTRLHKGIEDITPLETHKFQSRLQLLETYWKSFETIQDEIEATAPDERSLQAQEDERAELENRYLTIKDLILERTESRTTTNPPGQVPANISLPSLNLPSFSGNYHEWESFFDLFNAMIQKNPTLSDAQRLRYLKMCLRDPAKKTIAALEATDANFQKAIGLLQRRYYNPRLAINKHYGNLIHYPRMERESGRELRNLLDHYQENIRGLEVLKGNQWETIIVYMLLERMDANSRKEFEMTLTAEKNPDMEELSQFMEQRCWALDTVFTGDKTSSGNTNQPKPQKQDNGKKTCPVCRANHPVFQCTKFKEMTVSERSAFVRKKGLCYNCLSERHTVGACQAGGCRQCQRKHNTLLHQTNSGSNLNPQAPVFNATSIQISEVVLATALAQVRDQSQEWRDVRTFIDGGSQMNFITRRLADILGLEITPYKAHISGLSNSQVTKVQGITKICLRSRNTDFQMEFQVGVINKIATLPTKKLPPINPSEIQGITLADPLYHQPAPVEILLGAAAAFSIPTQRSRMEGGYPKYLHKTALGWLIAGDLPSSQQTESGGGSNFFCLEKQFKKFWEIEEVPRRIFLSQEEAFCEEDFILNHQRKADGRFQVRIPFKGDPKLLGHSRAMAMARFFHLEKKFRKEPQLQLPYKQFMKEFEESGHMIPVSHTEPEEANYLPHHAVFKECDKIKKIRVVFDASAKTDNGVSLNDVTAVGPTIQPTLFSILIRFRLRAIPLSADIEKMYLQIQVQPDHQKYHHIFWRDDPKKPIQEYALTTVTFGTSEAPFLATRVLSQLAKEDGDQLPTGKEALIKNFYMDDFAGSVDNVPQGAKVRHELTSLLKQGGFHLTKWQSSEDQLSDSKQNSMKILGYIWSILPDQLGVRRIEISKEKPTKRNILSTISKIYDPLGLLTPVVFSFKIFIQKLWLEKKDWDTPIGIELSTEWRNLEADLPQLERFSLPRHLGHKPQQPITEIHGFSDASEKGYGAVVYARCEGDPPSINLIAAKSRVAPLKSLNIPRLELCGAVLLSELIQGVLEAVDIPIQSINCWTDSTIALAWIKGSPHQWKTFVANRVASIQENLPTASWGFIKGEENPADLASRGTSPQLLDERWWQGPPWLRERKKGEFPNQEFSTTLETKIPKTICANALPKADFAEKFSSLNKLVRVSAWIWRFINQCRKRTKTKELWLGALEMRQALTFQIKVAQSNKYKAEITSLGKGENINPKSTLKSLNPFLDKEGIIRVKGRIIYSLLPPDEKYPIILPNDHQLTQLIISHEHLRLMHAQTNLLISSLRSKYWIPRIRSTVKGIIYRCIPCFRNKAEGFAPLMAPLPSFRVQPSPTFYHSGVDYFGPFLRRLRHGRGKPVLLKTYVVLFICLVTKAIHLEVVSDATTQSFLSVFRRFISRRGLPKKVYSDCGTNFQGASKQIGLLQEAHDLAASEGIQWHFNPPAAPHFGGIWEAGVKSAKTHLNRTLGRAVLTFEELTTVITQIEGCLNSRPLTPLVSEVGEPEALTPAHFLIGRPFVNLPQIDLSDNINVIKRWEIQQEMVQSFWKRWSKEYLHTLHQRQKWQFDKGGPRPGDVVILLQENSPPAHWPLARIIEVFPGPDGIIRTVSLQIGSSILKRPIHKLSPLPANSIEAPCFNPGEDVQEHHN